MAQTIAQAITIDVGHQPRLAVDELDRPFCTGGNALTAAVALGLIDMHDVSSGHRIRDSSRSFLRPAIPQGVKSMEPSQDRVAKHHPRSGVSHDGGDLLPHRRLVAVDRAAGTARLLRPERAAVQTAHCIVVERLALGAERARCCVVSPAIAFHHRPNRPFLPGQAGRFPAGWMVHKPS